MCDKNTWQYTELSEQPDCSAFSRSNDDLARARRIDGEQVCDHVSTHAVMLFPHQIRNRTA